MIQSSTITAFKKRKVGSIKTRPNKQPQVCNQLHQIQKSFGQQVIQRNHQFNDDSQSLLTMLQGIVQKLIQKNDFLAFEREVLLKENLMLKSNQFQKTNRCSEEIILDQGKNRNSHMYLSERSGKIDLFTLSRVASKNKIFQEGSINLQTEMGQDTLRQTLRDYNPSNLMKRYIKQNQKGKNIQELFNHHQTVRESPKNNKNQQVPLGYWHSWTNSLNQSGFKENDPVVMNIQTNRNSSNFGHNTDRFEGLQVEQIEYQAEKPNLKRCNSGSSGHFMINSLQSEGSSYPQKQQIRIRQNYNVSCSSDENDSQEFQQQKRQLITFENEKSDILSYLRIHNIAQVDSILNSKKYNQQQTPSQAASENNSVQQTPTLYKKQSSDGDMNEPLQYSQPMPTSRTKSRVNPHFFGKQEQIQEPNLGLVGSSSQNPIIQNLTLSYPSLQIIRCSMAPLEAPLRCFYLCMLNDKFMTKHFLNILNEIKNYGGDLNLIEGLYKDTNFWIQVAEKFILNYQTQYIESNSTNLNFNVNDIMHYINQNQLIDVVMVAILKQKLNYVFQNTDMSNCDSDYSKNAQSRKYIPPYELFQALSNEFNLQMIYKEGIYTFLPIYKEQSFYSNEDSYLLTNNKSNNVMESDSQSNIQVIKTSLDSGQQAIQKTEKICYGGPVFIVYQNNEEQVYEVMLPNIMNVQKNQTKRSNCSVRDSKSQSNQSVNQSSSEISEDDRTISYQFKTDTDEQFNYIYKSQQDNFYLKQISQYKIGANHDNWTLKYNQLELSDSSCKQSIDIHRFQEDESTQKTRNLQQLFLNQNVNSSFPLKIKHNSDRPFTSIHKTQQTDWDKITLQKKNDKCFIKNNSNRNSRLIYIEDQQENQG